MAAIDDEQNDLDAAEGLADLNRIALQDLPINREGEEWKELRLTVHTMNPTSSQHNIPLEKKLIERFNWIVTIVRS